MSPSHEPATSGATIKHERERRGWSQRRLISEVRDVARELREPEPGVTVQMISRYENGKSDPSAATLRFINLAFARTMVVDEDDTWENEVQRRAFLRSSAAAAGLALLNHGLGTEPWQRLSAVLQRSIGVDTSTVTDLETLTETFTTLYQTVAPSTLVSPVRSHLQTVTQLLHDGTRDEDLRHRLASVAGETAILLGWVSQDQDDHGSAQQYYMTALDAAVEARDNPLGAYAIASASTLPAFRSSPGQTLHLLTDAQIQGLDVDDASPTTRAWIHTLEAEAHARADDEAGALRALDAAESILADLQDEEEPRPRVPFFDQARLLGERGVTLVRLDMPHESMDYLDEAMRLTASDHKIQSRLLTNLALAHVRRGEIDQAVSIALRSLQIARRTDTADSLRDVRKISTALDPWRDSDPVKALDRAIGSAA